jgi:hypothetical protein
MILLRSFLSGHIRIKRTREYYDAGIGPNVPFGAIGVSPVVSQNFLTNTTVPSWMDASATTGNRMLYDSTGKLTYAPNNLLTYSEQFDNAAWTKIASSVSANTTNAPDGSATADTATVSSSGSFRYVAQSPTLPQSASFVFSVYAKYNTCQWIWLLGEASSDAFAWFDIQNGVVGSKSAGLTSQITPVGNGWYRCSISFTKLTATAAEQIGFGFANADNSTAATSGQNVYVWGAQLEAVTYQTLPSTYIPTTTAAYYGPRFDYDPSTLAAKGLLIEESRANIALQSNTFNTTWGIISIAAFGSGSVLNATTSPDGNTNAAQLTAAAATASHYMSQNITWTAAIHTVSFYVKRNTQQYVQITTWDGTVTRHMNFDILNGTVGTGSNSTGSITNIGNGWYRVSMTTSTAQAAAAGNTTLAFSNSSSANSNPNYATTGTESFFVYGCQIEAGSFATSYIPTTTASVTRVADIIKLSGAALTALQGAAGTVLVETNNINAVAGGGRIVGANSNKGFMVFNGSTQVSSWNGSTNINATIGGSGTWSSIVRSGNAFSGAGRSLVANNGTVTTTATSMGAITVAYIGTDTSPTTNTASGWYRSIAIYNQRLPDATLKTKSVVGSPL